MSLRQPLNPSKSKKGVNKGHIFLTLRMLQYSSDPGIWDKTYQDIFSILSAKILAVPIYMS